MKTNFFPRQAIAKILFVLHSRHPWYTPCPVWFTLDNSLTRRKRPIFKIKINYSKYSEINVRKPNFFPRQAIAEILFVLHSRQPWYTPYPVWFTLDNSLTRRKRPIFKIVYLNFFPRQAIPKNLFVLHSRYTWDTLYRVWFNFKKFLTIRKRPIFKNYLKLIIRINRKLTYEKLTFFLG